MLTLDATSIRLVALDAALAHAALADRDRFRARIAALVPSDWPAPPVRDVLDAQARGDVPGADAGWGVWAIVDAASRVVVGDAGFKGAPDEDGTVEIGYAVLPAHRERGVATEAARALATWALAQDGVHRVRATTEGNPASERVLEKAGFTRETGTPGVTTWSVRRHAAPDAETP